jgi:hypothetical protein
MFVEGDGDTRGWGGNRLADLARRHPAGFTAVLALLAAGVTILMLVDIAPSIVLYQGF